MSETASLEPNADNEGDELRQTIARLAPAPLQRDRAVAMKKRLLTRIARSMADEVGLQTVRLREARWSKIKAGVHATNLWRGPQGNSVLIEFAPGAVLPVHRHRWVEEGIVLRGSLQIGDLDVRAGDYHVSFPGSRHARISSLHGALAFLRGTALGETLAMATELLGGLLPGTGRPSRTVAAAELQWNSLLPGVSYAELGANEHVVSRFYRFEPGAACPQHAHTEIEECLLISGELFLGDTLLQAGDYQIAAKGSWHGIASTDSGACLYVRGQKHYPPANNR